MRVRSDAGAVLPPHLARRRESQKCCQPDRSRCYERRERIDSVINSDFRDVRGPDERNARFSRDGLGLLRGQDRFLGLLAQYARPCSGSLARPAHNSALATLTRLSGERNATRPTPTPCPDQRRRRRVSPLKQGVNRVVQVTTRAQSVVHVLPPRPCSGKPIHLSTRTRFGVGWMKDRLSTSRLETRGRRPPDQPPLLWLPHRRAADRVTHLCYGPERG